MTQCAIKGHHLMPFLHAFEPEPGSSVIFFVIIIAETGSVEGVKSEKHSRAFSVWLPRSRGAKMFVEFLYRLVYECEYRSSRERARPGSDEVGCRCGTAAGRGSRQLPLP
ncbi:hypothetical protein A8H26_02525 [Pluralibacter gergoviae]|nr:hypothetical protein A8H26_02525 [Pluralibacter gergoviae]PHH44949.1 hypothetical protein CRX51_03785 [Pluralibacter gergoviae]